MSKADKGVYAASITPVDANGQPDGERLIAHCRWLMSQGLTGVAPMGTTGEGNSLPLSFRLSVPGMFRDAGFEPSKVIFGTGSCATGDAIKATRAAVDSGFNNALVLPPFYYKNASEDGLFNYYEQLIDGVGTDKLRIYLYHFPQLSMTPITASLVRRLRAAFGPVIAGLKDSSGNFEGMLEYAKIDPDFHVFPGSESFLLDGLNNGCTGAISATTNATAALAAATYAAKGQEAEKLQDTISTIRLAISKYPLSAALKQIVAWRLGDNSWRQVLPPNTMLSAEQAQALRHSLESLGPDASNLLAS
jgi:4-hydroxy-tetrahydrodipicolinate synthase